MGFTTSDLFLLEEVGGLLIPNLFPQWKVGIFSTLNYILFVVQICSTAGMS